MRNNKPDKKERLGAYKRALETYKKEIERGLRNGMCYHINMAMVDLYGLSNDLQESETCYDPTNDYYPEFYSIAPRNSLMYWWNMDNTQVRIDGFKKIISMLSK